MLVNDADYRSAYQEGYGQTLAFLRSRRLAPPDAEDIAQEAWLRGWEKRSMLRDPKNLVGWINTIALNVLRNRYRRDRRLTQLGDRDDVVSPQEIVRRVDLQRCLGQFSLQDRRLIENLYALGLTSEEAGRMVGLSSVAVRVRVCRAIKKVRELRRSRSRALEQREIEVQPREDSGQR